MIWWYYLFYHQVSSFRSACDIICFMAFLNSFTMDFITRRNAAPTAACRVAAYELCNFISICGRKEPTRGARGEGGRSHLLRRLHTRRNHTLFRHPTHSTHSTFTPNSCAQEWVVRKTAWLNYFSIIWFATSFKMATKILRVECELRSAGDGAACRDHWYANDISSR